MTCEICGAKIVDHTLICGAPQCCPSCCRVAAMEAERDKLKRQRDELLAIVKRLRQAYSYSLIRPAAHDGCTCPDCVLFRDADAAIAACEGNAESAQ